MVGEEAQRGFTLVEALAALAIAATALVVLMGRLGSSADIQRTLSKHEIALDIAYNRLAEEVVNGLTADDRDGVIVLDNQKLNWRSWTEKSELEGFVRRNVAVTMPGEPEVTLFIYQAL